MKLLSRNPFLIVLLLIAEYEPIVARYYATENSPIKPYSVDTISTGRIISRNTQNSITIAHWNGGASYLADSQKEIEKLQEIKLLLKQHKIDIMGISEANIKWEINEANYHI